MRSLENGRVDFHSAREVFRGTVDVGSRPSKSRSFRSDFPVGEQLDSTKQIDKGLIPRILAEHNERR